MIGMVLLVAVAWGTGPGARAHSSAIFGVLKGRQHRVEAGRQAGDRWVYTARELSIGAFGHVWVLE